MASHRILIRAPNWLGDVCLSLPAVRDLRRNNFPEAHIEVLTRPALADVYRAVPEVDAVRTLTTLRRDVAALRGAFDVAVLFPNSFGSALTVRLANVEERWGYATDGRGLLLTRRAAIPREVRGRSQVYYYRAMLSGVGLQVSSVPDAALACPPEWSERGEALLDGDGPWVGINPGAFYGTAKRWVPERFAAVADLVARRTGARIVVMGGASERPLAENVAAQMETQALQLSGATTLGELIGVLARLRLLITNDSGSMHLAAALGTPVVAVFGPTDWRETAPFGTGHRLVRAETPCAPCLLRECPIDHRCMDAVAVDAVATAALEALVGEPPKPTTSVEALA